VDRLDLLESLPRTTNRAWPGAPADDPDVVEALQFAEREGHVERHQLDDSVEWVLTWRGKAHRNWLRDLNARPPRPAAERLAVLDSVPRTTTDLSTDPEEQDALMALYEAERDGHVYRIEDEYWEMWRLTNGGRAEQARLRASLEPPSRQRDGGT
jgi:hypothetical protein